MKAYKIITGGMMLLFASACNSFLDVVPDNRTVLDTPEAVKELLVSAYPDCHYYHVCEVMSDNVGERVVTGTHSRSILNEEMYYWEPGSQTGQDTPTYIWTGYYNAIAAANHALRAIREAGDTPEYAEAKGEALLCRAFNHFLLVNIFAEHYVPNGAESMLGIPYCTEPETVPIVYYKRNTLKETYELIEKDLLEGLPLIKDESYEAPKYHFTKAAAAAFAARFYLYKGEWDKVITYATRALGNNPVKKIRDLKGKQFNVSDKDYYQQNYFTSAEQSVILFVGGCSWWARDFSSTSLRFGMTKELSTELLTETVCGRSGSSCTYYVYSTYTASQACQMRKFKEQFKYNAVGSTTGKGYCFAALLSGEEALLNRAEAYTMKHQFDSALIDVNILLKERVRVNPEDINADFTPYQATLEKIKNFYDDLPELFPDVEPFYASEIDEDQMSILKCIVDWRRKEFLQEGLRWFDIKRFHLPVTHTFRVSDRAPIRRGKDDLRRAVQIPTEAQGFGVEPNPR